MKLYEISSTCRSGHHTVMNWIIKNFSGQQCGWQYKMNLLGNGMKILSEANHDIHLSYRFIEEQIPSTNILLVGYEDAPWNYTIFNNDREFKGIDSLDISNKYGFTYGSKVVIIRDFYNNLSSRIKSNEEKLFEKWDSKDVHTFDVENDFIVRWKNLAKACIENKVSYIRFEDWISNKKVRDQFIFENYGMRDIFGTEGIFGTKSSFGTTQGVLERKYQVEIPHKTMDLIQSDKELLELIKEMGY